MRGLGRTAFGQAALACALAGGLWADGASAQDETIKVGILHSLSGTMAISETTLKDVMLMLIEQQNAKGGLLGKKLEAVVVDPASDWPLFAEKARELIEVDKVAAVFGCWTSRQPQIRAAGLRGAELYPVLPRPVRGRGEPAQRLLHGRRAEPAGNPGRRLPDGARKASKRWVLAGTDYVYPRTTNKILEAYLKAKGVAPEDIMINYTPFGHSDWQTIVSEIKTFGWRRQEDGGRLDDQRRRQRALLQGAGEPGRQGRGYPRRRLLGRRGGAGWPRHRAAGRPPRGLELLHVGRHARERGVHRRVARVHRRRRRA